MIRHYCLNENMMYDKDDQSILGYFVADMERTGPYSMLSQAVAVAKGDPRFLGYLTGGSYGVGAPEYVRNFNANFLALPAVPSKVLDGVAGDENVTVRQISTDAHGTWYAVVNTGMQPVTTTVTLPGGPVKAVVSGEALSDDGTVEVTLYPFELQAWHVE